MSNGNSVNSKVVLTMAHCVCVFINVIELVKCLQEEVIMRFAELYLDKL